MSTSIATPAPGSRVSDAPGLDQAAAGKILLIRLRSIGDVLFTLPAVHLLRANFPQAKITFLVRKENAPLLEGFREVDAVTALDRALYRQRNLKLMAVETFSLLRRLRKEKFALVVDFQGYGETAWLTRWTGAPQRWGNVYETGRRWAYTRAIKRNNLIHPVEHNLSLLEECGLRPAPVRNDFALPDPALDEARRFFAAQGLNPTLPTLFIQPFTSEPRKAWPLEWHLVVAEHWRRRGVQVIFGGGPADRAALEPARQAGFPVSAGTSLLVAAGLMKLSTLVLGSDTGLLHLAVAMNKRVVMFMASIVPGCTHPFQHPEWVVPATDKRSIICIEIPAVIEACAQAFAELGAGTGAA
jgi:ADP-heptose:LPS heptosyltransferase